MVTAPSSPVWRRGRAAGGHQEATWAAMSYRILLSLRSPGGSGVWQADRPAFLLLQQVPESVAHHVVVVGEEDSYHGHLQQCGPPPGGNISG